MKKFDACLHFGASSSRGATVCSLPTRMISSCFVCLLMSTTTPSASAHGGVSAPFTYACSLACVHPLPWWQLPRLPVVNSNRENVSSLHDLRRQHIKQTQACFFLEIWHTLSHVLDTAVTQRKPWYLRMPHLSAAGTVCKWLNDLCVAEAAGPEADRYDDMRGLVCQNSREDTDGGEPCNSGPVPTSCPFFKPPASVRYV